MEKYEKFAALAEKDKLNASDKKAIAAEADALGVEINPNCPSCYKDAAIQIALHYKPEHKTQTGSKYELFDDIDITIHSFKFGTMRCCNATISDDAARRWLAAGLPRRFFKTIPNESNE